MKIFSDYLSPYQHLKEMFLSVAVSWSLPRVSHNALGQVCQQIRGSVAVYITALIQRIFALEWHDIQEVQQSNAVRATREIMSKNNECNE